MSIERHSPIKFIFIGLILLVTYFSFPASARPPRPTIVYTFGRMGGVFNLYTMEIDGSNIRQLTHGQREDSPDWSPDGTRIVFYSDGQLTTIECDDGNIQILPTGAAFLPQKPDWSPDETQIAFHAQAANTDIFVLSLTNGKIRNLTNHPRRDEHPTWSEDGKLIAFISNRDPKFWLKDANGKPIGATSDIYIMDVEGNNLTNLTQTQANEEFPAWSPDGTHLAFAHAVNGHQYELYVIDVNSRRTRRLTDFKKDSVRYSSWSADSQQIVFSLAQLNARRSDIYIIDRDGNNLRQLTHNDFGVIADTPSWFGSSLDISPVGLRHTTWGAVKRKENRKVE